MIKQKDIVFNDHNQLLDVYLPDNNKMKAVFLYFHGGGMIKGTKDGCDRFAEYLTQRSIAVVSANYRLYPQAKYPDFLEDAADAVAWIFSNKEKFAMCNNIFIGGSSAGGYISMMLCFDEWYLKKYNIKPTDIAGYIHDSGQPTAHYNVLKYSGIDSKRVIVDERAPLYFVGLQETYSPMLFLVSDNDMQNRYEQTMLMLSTLKHYGYDQVKIKFELMHGTHCAHCSAVGEDGTSVFGKIIYNFISEECCN